MVKFAGYYHGHSDGLLAAGRQLRRWPHLGLPGSAGVPAGAVADTSWCRTTWCPTLDDVVAAVIVEPVAANMGLVAPVPGFLEGLRRRVRPRRRAAHLRRGDHRVPRRSRRRRGAARRHARPVGFGKVIGGGLPIGAVRRPGRDHGRAGAARSRVPGGHPVGEPAGHRGGSGCARRCSTTRAYERLAAASSDSPTGSHDAFGEAAVDRRGHPVASLVGVFAGRRSRPTDYAAAKRIDEGRYARALPRHARPRASPSLPGPTRSCFPGLAHTDAVIDESSIAPPTLVSAAPAPSLTWVATSAPISAARREARPLTADGTKSMATGSRPMRWCCSAPRATSPTRGCSPHI